MTNAIYTDRLAALRSRMEATDTDLVALGPSTHMAWLSGVNPHGDERPVMLLVGREAEGFLMPSLNADSARQMTELPFFPWKDDEGPAKALSDLLDHVGVADMTDPSIVIDETMRADFAFRLTDAIPTQYRRFTDDTVGLLRSRKDASEIAAIKAAHLLNDQAVKIAFDSLREGMTERELQDIIRTHYKANGATPEFTIIGFGANGAFPHHHTGDTKLTANTAVLIDTGCRLNGYPSDMTRSGFFGTPSAEYEKVFETVELAVQAALKAAKPGVRAQEIDAAARDAITAAGYGELFLHRTGHGLGVDVHEPPYITATSDVVLEAGNVFSIEPGIYLAGEYGVRLEEIVVLTDDGNAVFSELSRDMKTAPC
ncbi:M24 family metallopeptidase [Shimia haliotis]|uniref:Xaa-Pro aminopeptidase n=1 Tax=Shimia haliotis TaxID=1280847 RepID=A0A1I4GZX4_9RHOB|nr:Xaa-Pro peptidase family protein [Shimia haliotis]SFL35485.1 Xaa-Pro aminopeptidase [Shimia haliotis]